MHYHPYLSHFQCKLSYLRIPAFRPRGASMVVLINMTLVFGELFLSPHASQFAIPFQSFIESELERTTRQPDHRRSQGHLGISLDWKKSTICTISTIHYMHFMPPCDLSLAILITKWNSSQERYFVPLKNILPFKLSRLPIFSFKCASQNRFILKSS